MKNRSYVYKGRRLAAAKVEGKVSILQIF